jgi:hypothetical protein
MASNFKEVNKLDLLIADCHEAIRRHGAHATVAFTIPGEWGKQTYKRMFPSGPKGWIIANTHDGKKLIVRFWAAATLTKLEEIRNGIITSGN